MREVKYYVAWDDSEFETQEECMEYEQGVVIAMSTINNCYDFIDKNGKRYDPPKNLNIDDWQDWFFDAAEHCQWIRVYRTLPDLAVDFINTQIGYCICPVDFDNKTGLFEYDELKNEWVKVDE